MGLFDDYYAGKAIDGYNYYGAHFVDDGVVFRLYAPKAKSVSIIGEFNYWNHDAHFLKKIDSYTWEICISGIQEYCMYKYIIETENGEFLEKSDPFGFYNEKRPSWASKVVNIDNYKWNDWQWMENRSRNYDRALNIYEVHTGGFKRDENGSCYTYYQLITELIPYVKEMGYTHIELLPLNEHSLDESWGYQQYGYFSVTSRYGNNYQFQMFVDACHNNGIGVIMDVVPVHFVSDDFGLKRFDGTDLYCSSDRKIAESSWGTYYFDYSKPHVRSFMMSSMTLWIDKYHIDGLRLDAISNLIFYQGNKNLGVNENGISFMKQFNYLIHQRYPSVMTIAEDSSDYSAVTNLNSADSLGFDYKWDLGWMNDTLKYYGMDTEYRHYNHNLINFSMYYFYSERFILPFSHDENVHSKKTLVDKMDGKYEDKFAQYRNLMVYMYTHPGKKLNFMGNEIASFREFDEKKQLDWFILSYPVHSAFKRMVRDLNFIYSAHPAFYKYDYQQKGYQWIDADNSSQRIYSYIRYDDSDCYVVILNMSPIAYEDYKLGVPEYGYYTEIINSEKDIYGGCNMCNYHKVVARKDCIHSFKYSINIRIAPYAAIILTTKNKGGR